MKYPLLHLTVLLLYSLSLLFVPVRACAQPEGVVGYNLEWHSGHQVYSYVFAGLVSSRGKPCPNAKIQLQISTPTEERVEETVASASGAYELKVDLSGQPDQAMQWKLVAQSPETSATEIEGHSILTEGENPVAVQRPIQLVQG